MLRHTLSGPRAALVLALLGTLIAVNRFGLPSARILRANDVVVETAEVLYVPRTNLMRALCLGYDQAAADFVWLRTVDYFARHFLGDRRYAWLEHFLEQVLALDPNFRSVYHWAGVNVLYGRRFTNENVMRSNHFYRRAFEQFPDDAEAAYRLGINYYFELKTTDEAQRTAWRETALSWFEIAANMPNAPGHMQRLVASLYSRLGRHQAALQYLLEMYASAESEQKRKVLRRRIEAVRADVDLEALDEARREFEARREATFPYLTDDQYIALGEPSANRPADVHWRDLLPIAEVAAEDDPGAGASPDPAAPME